LFKESKTDYLGNHLKKLLGVKRNMLEDSVLIRDPFKGWKGPNRTDAENLPFLGNSPNIIELRVQMKGKDPNGSIGMSGFGWIANRYKSIGEPAGNETINWWRRLNNWVSKKAVARIQSSGPLEGTDNRIWAFPSAYDKIRSGMKRDLNPF
jgi:hypothetical protein